MRKMQIKIMRYCYPPVRMPQFWNSDKADKSGCENNRSSQTLVGMQNLEYILVFACKTKHTLTIGSSSHTPWYLSKGVENLSPPQKAT